MSSVHPRVDTLAEPPWVEHGARSRDSGLETSLGDFDPHGGPQDRTREWGQGQKPVSDPSPQNQIQLLYQQLIRTKLPFELLIYEDASPPPYPAINQKVAELGPEVIYKLLPENLGRAGIRNLLAQEARYPQILFLDADSGFLDGFVDNYLPFLDPQQFPVVAGGRHYPPLAQIEPNHRLHQKYGQEREVLDANAQGDALYQGFQTNNFLVSRELVLRHSFPTDFTGYGHEDSLWGWQLRELGLTVLRINNPIVHLGLEPAAIFLEKQEEAVYNLKKLEAQDPSLPTRLGQFAKRWKWLRPFLNPILSGLAPIAKRRLLRTQPGSLYWLDLLKLHWYWSS